MKLLTNGGKLRVIDGKLVLGDDGDPCCCGGPRLDCFCFDTAKPPAYGLVRISGLSGTFTIYTDWVFAFDGWRRTKFTLQFFDSSSCSCPGCTFAEGGEPFYGSTIPMVMHVWTEWSDADGGSVLTTEYEGWFAVQVGWMLSCDELMLNAPDPSDGGWPEDGWLASAVFFRASITPTTTGSVANDITSVDEGANEYPAHSTLTIERNVATCRLCTRHPIQVEDPENPGTYAVQESIIDSCFTATSEWTASVLDNGAYDEFGGTYFAARGNVEAEAPTSADLRTVSRAPASASLFVPYMKIEAFSGSPCCGATGTYIVPAFVEGTPIIDPTSTGTPYDGFPSTITVTAGECEYLCQGGKRDFTSCPSAYSINVSGCTGGAAVLNGSWIVSRTSRTNYEAIISGTDASINDGDYVPDFVDEIRVSVINGGNYLIFHTTPRDCDNCPADYTWVFKEGSAGTSGATVTVT